MEDWLSEAQKGRFEVLSQNGYIVGAPTYLPVGEPALCRPVAGELPRPAFPEPLATAAATRWRGRAQVSLMFARAHADAGDVVPCAGMLAQADPLHGSREARASAANGCSTRSVWFGAPGLEDLQATLAHPGGTATELAASVGAVSAALGVEPLSAR